ncbi:MAG: MotA/TolQ/ExbB proton channel family protein, partial [Planctomycetales bacterium]|nr:MotA/TolQ/ExbB proton channel family protein [Planctomycetales bacterium]
EDTVKDRRRAWILLGLMLVVFAGSLACAGVAYAQEEEGPKRKEMTLFDTFMAGGTIGMCIVAINVVTLALAIEYGVMWRRDKLIPPEILGELEVLFEDEEYEEALELCEAEPSWLTNVVAAGIPKMSAGYDTMMESMMGQSDFEALKLHQKNGWIAVACNIAPMLGLLGTVQGMIAAFQKIATSVGAPEPAELADSIGLALVTTFEGLVVAIPFVCVFAFFKNKIGKLAVEVSNTVEDLFERFRPTKK